MVTIETRIGAPIAAGATSVVPIARSVRLELGSAAMAWTRAVGVTVLPALGGPTRSDGGETELPIHDLTRRWQLALLGAGLLGSLALWLGGRRRRVLKVGRSAPYRGSGARRSK